MKMCMIDIETLDTADTAVILQIGGCIFDVKTDGVTEGVVTDKQAFNLPLHWVDEQKNRTISTSTLDWWMKQDANIRNDVFYGGYRFLPDSAIRSIATHLREVKYFWSKGKFDFDILGNMFEQYGLDTPWSFRQIFDYRTMLVMANLKYGYVETKSNTHDAADDAVNQAQNLVNILNLMDRR